MEEGESHSLSSCSSIDYPPTPGKSAAAVSGVVGQTAADIVVVAAVAAAASPPERRSSRQKA